MARLTWPARPRILDAGCGSGRNMALLAAFGDVTGLENATASVEAARRRAIGPVVAGSLEEPLPFANASFDLATAFDVLEHLDQPTEALSELQRVVAAGGRLLVTVPAYPALWGVHDELSHHRRRYTRTTLRAEAAQAGWTLERLTSFNTVLLAPIAAVRLSQRVRPTGGRERSDIDRTPSWMSALLEQPLRAEAALLRRGVSLPVGVSLLATFRR